MTLISSEQNREHRSNCEGDDHAAFGNDISSLLMLLWYYMNSKREENIIIDRLSIIVIG